MSVEMILTTTPVDYDAITRAAHQQIKQEWLDTGMTEEEWERGERIAVLLDHMLAAGIPDEEVVLRLQGLNERELAALEKQCIPSEVK